MRALETPQELDMAHRLMMKSIPPTHPMWKTMPPDPAEDSQRYSYMLGESYRHRMTFGSFHEGKLVALMICFPVREYFKLTPPKCPNSKLFSIMAPHEKRLDEALLKYVTEHKEMDTSVFCEWGLVDPDVQSKKLAPLSMYECLKILAQLGYRSIFGVMSSPKGQRLTNQALGPILAEEVFQ